MPFGPTDLFWIGVVPSVAAALILLACSRLRLRPNAAWALSVGGSLIAGMIGQSVRIGWHTALEKLLRPHVALDWLPWLVLVATGISVLAAYAPRDWQRWLVALACLCAITIPFRLLASNASAMSRWSTVEKLVILAFWSIAFAAWWCTLALGRRNHQPLVRCGLLLVVAIGTAMTVALSGAITLGELGGLAAAALLGATATAAAFDQLESGPSGADGPLAAMLGGLILLGYFYSGLPSMNAALLGISLAAAGWLPEGWPEHPAWRATVRAVLTLFPLGIAVATALSAAMADPYA